MSASVNPALRELVDGVEEEASRRGLQMILADTHDDPEHEERVVARMLAHHVNGLLMVPSVRWEEGALRLIRERTVPFVVVDRLQEVRADQVGVENEAAAGSLVEHLPVSYTHLDVYKRQAQGCPAGLRGGGPGLRLSLIHI